MIVNFNKICVVDLETTGINTDTCSIIQIAAIAIDPRTLDVMPGSELNMMMRPDPATIETGALEFHCKRLQKDQDVLLKEWSEFPDPKVVWPEFVKYLKKYHTKQDRQTKFTAPIAAGANIIKFDLPIIDKYNSLYNDNKALFQARDKIDLLHWFFPWFENNSDITSYAMDYMRDYFGMSKDNAHDALQDVKDCGQMIIRFMKLFRSTASKVKFKGAFGRGE